MTRSGAWLPPLKSSEISGSVRPSGGARSKFGIRKPAQKPDEQAFSCLLRARFHYSETDTL
jgi:hypothetical protein